MNNSRECDLVLEGGLNVWIKCWWKSVIDDKVVCDIYWLKNDGIILYMVELVMF